MEVVAAAPRCQLLLIVLMAAMLLPQMKGSLMFVRRKIARTIELQEGISKGKWMELENIILSEVIQTQKDKHGWSSSLEKVTIRIIALGVSCDCGLLHHLSTLQLHLCPMSLYHIWYI
ncbi:hypothetical protein STEG23_017731, partial [Scotinomys teguina]